MNCSVLWLSRFYLARVLWSVKFVACGCSLLNINVKCKELSLVWYSVVLDFKIGLSG